MPIARAVPEDADENYSAQAAHPGVLYGKVGHR